jgi:hypothetical protein
LVRQVASVTYAPTLITLVATDGSPIVLRPERIASRDEHLNVVLLDQTVVQHRTRVVAIVERGQAADRHIDNIDVTLLGHVDHALDQGVGGASSDK